MFEVIPIQMRMRRLTGRVTGIQVSAAWTALPCREVSRLVAPFGPAEQVWLVLRSGLAAWLCDVVQRRVFKSMSSKGQCVARQLQADKRRSVMLDAEKCSALYVLHATGPS